ncbi:NAD(P)H-hydrate epimerase [Botrimarina sp.]|uniref:NAD(P)H-hydrate epimerase n=1 Tax=Botrimarina sp. TaxID=2795802 RepID=UPI0032F00A18
MTRDQLREFDGKAVQRFGLPSLLLMENAGRGCVDVLERLGVGGPVVVLAGKGNNGGDGFAVARHLRVRGHRVKVALAASPGDLSGDPEAMFHALTPCGATLLDLTGVHDLLFLEELDAMADGAVWIVDALLGTGASGDPRPPYDTLIDWANDQPARRLAIDLPSGLDCDTGKPFAPTFRADHTVTMVAEKKGFSAESARPFVGEVHVVDIGVPRDSA